MSANEVDSDEANNQTTEDTTIDPAEGEVRADFNGDGFADLVVGAPDEDVGSAVEAGMVSVIYGSATGLDLANTTTLQQGTVGSYTEAGDRFGAAAP